MVWFENYIDVTIGNQQLSPKGKAQRLWVEIPVGRSLPKWGTPKSERIW